MSDDWYEIAFGRVYRAVYAHRDEAEAARVAGRLAPLLGTSSRVLDVACGDGRYLSAFAQEGIEMFGVDLSAHLLSEAAVRRDIGGRLVRCDMRSLPFVGGSFRGAINMFTSFGYFDTDLDNLRVIQEVGRVLGHGGTFVLDFINADAVRADSLRPSRRRGGDATIEEERWLEAGGLTLAKRVVYRPDTGEPVEYVERVRLYRLEDLRVMMESGGMVVRRAYGDYDLGDFDPTTSARLLVLGEKGSDA